MKRLRIFILVFCLAVSFPLAYVAWRTYTGLAQEERAQLTYFSEALLDEMELTLAELIETEENRSVEEYRHTLSREGLPPRPSPLTQNPSHSYILGYFQNNPDGSFQTPLVADLQQVPDDRLSVVNRLMAINNEFNEKKLDTKPRLSSAPAKGAGTSRAPEISEGSKTSETAMTSEPSDFQEVSEPSAAPDIAKELIAENKQKQRPGLADRYLAPAPQQKSKAYLGRKETRTEEISAQQARNITLQKLNDESLVQQTERESSLSPAEKVAEQDWEDSEKKKSMAASLPVSGVADSDSFGEPNRSAASTRFQVEVAPFQSVFINEEEVFIFRRIVINQQIYRQGFVVAIPALLDDLVEKQFRGQPLSKYMGLRMQIVDSNGARDIIRAGALSNAPGLSIGRRFPAPFGFLRATLQAENIPASPARRPLNISLAFLTAVMALGLIAIYQSARTVLDMSERRSQFVSSVTHELKTPLTNIRMYVEMLEQGIAATPQREQEYLQVLDTESARLSRLINNVLELAKLEKGQRRFQFKEGDLADVFSEVSLVMSQKLKQEDFTLAFDARQIPAFVYDHEVLVQLLVNLIENCVKFGKHSPQKNITVSAITEKDHIRIAVSDTGPGIPRYALKKVFTDFYRVDNALTRNTGGTGIGLALVKKFVEAMGGEVRAANNEKAGCTISLRLPIKPHQG